jgi:hypothetical protein
MDGWQELEECRRTLAVLNAEYSQLRNRHESLVHAAHVLTWSMEVLTQEDLASAAAGMQWSLGVSNQQLENDLRKLTSDLEHIMPNNMQSSTLPDSHAEARALSALGSAAERLTTARRLVAEKEERCALLLAQVRSK